MLTVAYAVGRNPLQGGEYYRALRPAALSSRDLGWHTAVCERLGSVEGSNKIVGQAYGGTHILEPDVWIIRPIGRETEGSVQFLEMVDGMHSAGQIVIADLDDDLWAHEDWSDDREGTDDRFEDWCWEVDGWLASTPYLADRITAIAARRHKPAPRILVAPNCYDPVILGMNSHPTPGYRIGTRLWLSGRMSHDLEIYRDCYTPLLEELDLSFVHIGREADVIEGPGAHARNFVDDCDMPADRVIELPSTTIPELGRILGSTVNIAAIAIADHPFNRAKTETHAIEVASAGLPMVAATTLSIYDGIPGKVDPTPTAVRERVEYLLDRKSWHEESDRARKWARKTSVRCERTHIVALQSLVKELLER
jgi:hypothetical protein